MPFTDLTPPPFCCIVNRAVNKFHIGSPSQRIVKSARLINVYSSRACNPYILNFNEASYIFDSIKMKSFPEFQLHILLNWHIDGKSNFPVFLHSCAIEDS